MQPVIGGEKVCADKTKLTQDGIQMIDWAGRWVLLVSHRVHHSGRTLHMEFGSGARTVPRCVDPPLCRQEWQAGPLFSYAGPTVSGCITVPESVWKSLGRLTALHGCREHSMWCRIFKTCIRGRTTRSATARYQCQPRRAIWKFGYVDIGSGEL